MFALMCLNTEASHIVAILKILETASATPQPLSRHTYVINFKILHLVLKLLHSRDFQINKPI